MLKKNSRFLLITLVSTLVSACATFSAGNLFSHYSVQNQILYMTVASGQYHKAQQALPENVAGDILDNMEKGRVSFLNQLFSESKVYFERSELAVRAQQDQALISLSEHAAKIGALAANDNLTNYYPADYEVGFLHLYLALNYLSENSLEGALVEVRKANLVQERAKKAREADLAAAEREVKSSELKPNLGSVLSRYPDAGEQLQAVQNGYLLYLSALLYETAGELNSAYVDYRRALAVMPDNREIINGTMRTAAKLNMQQDLLKLEQQYGKYSKLLESTGRIIVIDEQGIVNARQGWKMALPIYSDGNLAHLTLSLPYYPNYALAQFIPIRIDNKMMSQSRLVDVNLMAQQDLTERMPTILLRQALRVVAKEQLRRKAAEKDDVGSVLLNIWNTLTEQPDTRSWQTLPAEVYSSSEVVEAGEYELKFGAQSYNVEVGKGRTILVWISRQGNNAIVWHKQLGSL